MKEISCVLSFFFFSCVHKNLKLHKHLQFNDNYTEGLKTISSTYNVKYYVN